MARNKYLMVCDHAMYFSNYKFKRKYRSTNPYLHWFNSKDDVDLALISLRMINVPYRVYNKGGLGAVLTQGKASKEMIGLALQEVRSLG